MNSWKSVRNSWLLESSVVPRDPWGIGSREPCRCRNPSTLKSSAPANCQLRTENTARMDWRKPAWERTHAFKPVLFKSQLHSGPSGKGFLGGDMFPLCDRIMFLSLIMNLPLEDVKHRLKDCKCLTGVSDLQPMGWMWRRVAMNAAQHKIVNLLRTLGDFFLCVWLHVTMSLMCGPRQLFFQCGTETPKGWTSLLECPGDPYYPRS